LLLRLVELLELLQPPEETTTVVAAAVVEGEKKALSPFGLEGTEV
jgi:hypothetical protein